jgi:hypothetical protein
MVAIQRRPGIGRRILKIYKIKVVNNITDSQRNPAEINIVNSIRVIFRTDLIPDVVRAANAFLAIWFHCSVSRRENPCEQKEQGSELQERSCRKYAHDDSGIPFSETMSHLDKNNKNFSKEWAYYKIKESSMFFFVES